MSALSDFGGRVGRHAGIYGIGSGIGVAVGLINLAILTRFLSPTEFGQYALYLSLSALLILLYGLVLFKGSIRLVFGGDDDDDDEDEDDGSDGEKDVEGQARAALGTALFVTAAVGLIGSAIVALFPGVPATLIGQGGEPEELILYAAIAGWLGAVWRLASNVPRRERRSSLYVVLQASRPLLILAVTVPLVAAGAGVRGAVIGLAAGTAIAAIIALVAIHSSWRPVVRLSFLPTIVRRGAPYLPLVISFWVIQNAGVFILVQFASDADVGLFRLASQIAAFGSYGVTAFLRASGPLSREPIHKAVRAEQGPGRMATLMSTYFVLGTIGIVLFFALAADVLVKIAPDSYGAAAPLAPLVVTSVVLNGWFRVVYRYGRFPRKKAAKMSFAVVAGVVFLAVAFALAPTSGAYGIAWAMVAGFAVATGGLLALAQRSEHPIPIAHRRLPAGIAIAVACYFAAYLLERFAGVPSPVGAAIGMLAYPLLLVVSGVIPRGHVQPLRDMSIAAVRPGRGDSALRLKRLTRREWRVVRMFARDGRDPAAVAAKTGRSEEQVLTELVAGLRRLGGLGKPAPGDARLGAYLVSEASIADRDQVWKRLASAGADPFDTDRLGITLERARRLPAEEWKRDR